MFFAPCGNVARRLDATTVLHFAISCVLKMCGSNVLLGSVLTQFQVQEETLTQNQHPFSEKGNSCGCGFHRSLATRLTVSPPT